MTTGVSPPTAADSCVPHTAVSLQIGLASPSSGMLYACFHLTPDIDLVVVAFRGMFSKEVIGKMKKGAYLVNNARGAIVDREAVVEACKSGQLGGIHPASPLLLLPPPPWSQECLSPSHHCYILLPTVPIVCLPCVLPTSRLCCLSQHHQ